MNDNFDIETLPITEQIKTNYEDIINLLGEEIGRASCRERV